jgi:hypothetical protein
MGAVNSTVGVACGMSLGGLACLWIRLKPWYEKILGALAAFVFASMMLFRMAGL